jgi:ABC-type bacteriocin/lantibiotic exporter with double-glycine peptidase domain
MSLPNGYQYNVKERGACYYLGQRQLISSCLCNQLSILILDEVTHQLIHIQSNLFKMLQIKSLKVQNIYCDCATVWQL